MKNVFLVHGSIGKPFENWFPWLESELTKVNVKCVIPTFPTPEWQEYEKWKRLMDYYVDAGIVNKDTILVGHSCGSIFLVHYIIERKIDVSGLICFSGYNQFISGFEFMDNLNKSFYMDVDNYDVRKYAEYVYAFYGDDDPNIPQNVLQDFANRIGAQKGNCIEKAGHFNTNAGFDKCDIALNTILSIIGNKGKN